MTETVVEKYPVLQATMTAAYERWQAAEKMSAAEFLEGLSAKESFAVRVGNLNYQVENGGFSQYWGNGYAMNGSLGEVREICRWLVTFARDRSQDEQKAAAEVLALVARFTEILGPNLDPNKRVVEVEESSYRSRRRASFYDSLEDEEDDDGPETRMLARIETEKLDNRFYAVNDVWMGLAEAYLVATYK
jgi:hypothetical protein